MSTIVNERVPLGYEEAVERLAEGDRIHVVSNPTGGLMIGADWDRAKVLDFFRNNMIELAGPIASGSGHGMVSITSEARLFFATKEARQ